MTDNVWQTPLKISLLFSLEDQVTYVILIMHYEFQKQKREREKHDELLTIRSII